MSVEPSLLNKLTLITVRHNLVENYGFIKGHHSLSLSSIKCYKNPSSQIRASLIYICNMKIKCTIPRNIPHQDQLHLRIYILSVYSPFSDRVGLPLHNIHIPSPFTSIMDIFFVDLCFYTH